MDPQLPNYQQLALYVGKNFPVTILCSDTKTQHQTGFQIGGGSVDLSTVMGDLVDDQLRETLTASQQ